MFLATALPAQQHPEGIAAATASLPAAAGIVLETSRGLVTFDGAAVMLLPPGQPPRTLLQLAGFSFGSFLIEVGPGQVLFGHTNIGNTADAVWLLPLLGPAPTQALAKLKLNYDAVALDGHRVLVSARTGGWSVNVNDLVVVDLATGHLQQLATVPGASGPLAVSADGDVYYATASPLFNPPPGTVDVVRFRQSVIDQALAAQQVLGIGAAETVLTGIDAASDLAFDDDGDLFFVDWMNALVGEISDAVGPVPALAAPLTTYAGAGVFPSQLQFVAATGPGVFEPFQPVASTMRIHESDFVTVNQVRSVQPAPALLAATAPSPVPAGPFQLITTQGPALGLGLLVFAPATTPGSLTFLLPGFEQPLVLSAALQSSPVLLPIAFDANGNFVLTVVNPGFAPALGATTQVVFLSPVGVLGASLPLALQIAQ